MTQEKIYTHNNLTDDRGYKKCQCQYCGIVAQCTPTFDFYAKKSGDGLKCETCFKEELRSLDVKALYKII